MESGTDFVMVRSDPIDYILDTLQPMQKQFAATASGTNHADALLAALAGVEMEAENKLAETEREYRENIESAGCEAQRLWTWHAVLNNEHANLLVEALDLSRAIEQSESSVTRDAYQRRLDALQVQLAAHKQALDEVAHRANNALQDMVFIAKAMLASPERRAILDEREQTEHKLLQEHQKYHNRVARNAKRYERRLRTFVRQNKEMCQTVTAQAHPARVRSDGDQSSDSESSGGLHSE